MLYQSPIEALARRRATLRQIEFAREACTLFEDSDDAVFQPVDHGLAIFAAHEKALDAPRRILASTYGESIEVRGPKVRTIPGPPLQEPVMHVRIESRREDEAAVLRELRLRGARVIEECRRGRIFIVRAEARLERLLGLPATLDRLTDGSAAQALSLLRYDPRESCHSMSTGP